MLFINDAAFPRFTRELSLSLNDLPDRLVINFPPHLQNLKLPQTLTLPDSYFH